MLQVGVSGCDLILAASEQGLKASSGEEVANRENKRDKEAEKKIITNTNE